MMIEGEERTTRRSLSAPRRKTDWSRVDATSDADIEAAVRNDPDAAPLVDEGGPRRES